MIELHVDLPSSPRLPVWTTSDSRTKPLGAPPQPHLRVATPPRRRLATSPCLHHIGEASQGSNVIATFAHRMSPSLCRKVCRRGTRLTHKPGSKPNVYTTTKHRNFSKPTTGPTRNPLHGAPNVFLNVMMLTLSSLKQSVHSTRKHVRALITIDEVFERVAPGRGRNTPKSMVSELVTQTENLTAALHSPDSRGERLGVLDPASDQSEGKDVFHRPDRLSWPQSVLLHRVEGPRRFSTGCHHSRSWWPPSHVRGTR